MLELGLWKDFNNGVRYGYSENIYTSLWSPRLGINYQFGINGTQHVLRGVVGRSLNTHHITQPLLVPAETAGFPWFIDYGSGTEMRQAGAAWEAQWNPLTFTVLRLNALRLSVPTLHGFQPSHLADLATLPGLLRLKPYSGQLPGSVGGSLGEEICS